MAWCDVAVRPSRLHIFIAVIPNVVVVQSSRPHDSTVVEEVRARRPHHNRTTLVFVGQASRLLLNRKER